MGIAKYALTLPLRMALSALSLFDSIETERRQKEASLTFYSTAPCQTTTKKRTT